LLLQGSTASNPRKIPLPLLVLSALFQSAADHSTTYLRLRQPVPGWQEQGGFAVSNYLQASEALSLLSPGRV
jgi:hypothetical protein